MRREDLEHLQRPYLPEARQNPRRFPTALGLDLSEIASLADEIARDLDPARHGVGWWSPYPGTRRRILVSDHLYCCASTIETNLVEAKLHLIEALDAADREEARFRTAVRFSGEQPKLAVPEANSPADELPSIMQHLHVVGVMRALASALDCLGAVIVGVLAVPTPIFRTDLKRSLTALTKLGPRSTALQADAHARIARSIESAGPPGWLEWILEYRNMLVHRGRRMHTFDLQPKGIKLFSAVGELIVPPTLVPLLPNDPGRSDVEAFHDGPTQHFLLTENGWHTMHSAIGSTLYVVEQAGRVLGESWRARRDDPDMLHQPREQWPSIAVAPPSFPGYAQGTVPFNVSQITVRPTFLRRLTAASLDDANRQKWADFD